MISELSVGSMIDILNIRRNYLPANDRKKMRYLPAGPTKILPKTLTKVGSKLIKKKVNLIQIIDDFYKQYDSEK